MPLLSLSSAWKLGILPLSLPGSAWKPPATASANSGSSRRRRWEIRNKESASRSHHRTKEPQQMLHRTSALFLSIYLSLALPPLSGSSCRGRQKEWGQRQKAATASESETTGVGFSLSTSGDSRCLRDSTPSDTLFNRWCSVTWVLKYLP